MTPIDPYRILGVSHDAEDVVIRAAYRALMQRYHPDKFNNQGREIDLSAKSEAAKRIAQIQQAYRILSGKGRRSDSGNEQNSINFESAIYSEWPNLIEARSWQALLDFHPQFQAQFSLLEKQQPELAREYKTLFLELISEKMLSRIVNRISKKEESQTHIDVD
jgi:curved DNA-binding protein CbpA